MASPANQDRVGHVIVLGNGESDPWVNDAVCIEKAFSNLGFKFPKVYEDFMNWSGNVCIAGTAPGLRAMLKEIERKCESSILLVYVICVFYRRGRAGASRRQREADYPEGYLRSLHGEEDRRGEENDIHPETNDTDIVEILCEGLTKPNSIDLVLTSVIRRAKERDLQGIPTFSSTMSESLCLHKSENACFCPRVEGARSLTKMKSKFVFAWLFEKLQNADPFQVDEEAKAIRDNFEAFGFIVDIKRGEITTDQILKELKKIPICDFVVIIISSHGFENGVTLTCDGVFTLKDFWESIEGLQKIPKVIISERCRGTSPGCRMGGLKASPKGAPRLLHTKLPGNTITIFSSTEGSESWAFKRSANVPVPTDSCSSAPGPPTTVPGEHDPHSSDPAPTNDGPTFSFLLQAICLNLEDYRKKKGVAEMFHFLHEVTAMVAEVNVITKSGTVNQQVTFASNMAESFLFETL